jgi:hypothetical protein
VKGVLRRGFLFEFEIPDTWGEQRAGDRFIYRGHGGEELIVSGTLITGTGQETDLQALRRRLFDNAVRAVNEAASHPDLQIVRPLRRDEALPDIECWTLHAQTKGGDTMFAEAIATNESGLLLVTFEAPNKAECMAEYGRFLKSLRRASVH